MKTKKFLVLAVLTWIFASLATMNVPVQAEAPDVTIWVDMSPDGYIPGKVPGPPPGGLVFVDLWIKSPASWDGTEYGIVQYMISVKVDPDVLDPMGFDAITAGGTGTFLYDYLVRSYLIYYGFSVNTLSPVIDHAAGTMEWLTEGILGPYPAPTGAGGTSWLITLVFASKSETAYSPIDLYYEVDIDAWYYQAWDTTAEFPIPVDVVYDGHYNLPPGGRTFDAMGFFPPPAPLGSDWHEEEPDFCNEWSLDSWVDNGDGLLGPSDQIDMTRAIDEKNVDFHVEWVAPIITPNDGNPDMLAIEKIPEPEFPLGSVAPIAMIAAVAYIWWVTRRKRQEAA